MRRTYERIFKLKVCRAIESGKRSVKFISEEYHISRPIISRWVSEFKRYGNKAFSGRGRRLPDRAKLYALTKENQRLRMECDILKAFEAYVKRKK